MKFALPNAPGRPPLWNPCGNGLLSAPGKKSSHISNPEYKVNLLPEPLLPEDEPLVVVAAKRDKMDLSDICKRCATGGMRASVAGKRDTSDFISDSSSSSWLRTCELKKPSFHLLDEHRT